MMNPTSPTPPEGYADWLAQLKADIALRRQRAALAVNAEHCPDARFGQQPADQLPWFHIVTLLTQLISADLRVKDAERIVGATV